MVAKYNSIQVLNQAYDVCYLVKQLGRQCPISAGVLCVCVCACICVCVCVCVHARMYLHVCMYTDFPRSYDKQ